MKTRFVLQLLCFLGFAISNSPAFALRYVPIEIYLDGELILEGNASDGGDRDADEVWDALNEVNLGATEAFKRMFGENIGDQFTVLKKRKEGEQPLKIRIEVAYGGVAETTGLRILRKPPDVAGRVWRIHSKEVQQLFNERLIRRGDVGGLKNPKRNK